MSAISIFLLVIFVITALLLLVIILLQDEQGEGLGGIFGGGGMSGQFGNRKGNPLSRATSVLGIVFLLTCFGLAWTNRTTNLENIEASARQAERENSSENWWELPNEEASVEIGTEAETIEFSPEPNEEGTEDPPQEESEDQ